MIVWLYASEVNGFDILIRNDDDDKYVGMHHRKNKWTNHVALVMGQLLFENFERSVTVEEQTSTFSFIVWESRDFFPISS